MPRKKQSKTEVHREYVVYCYNGLERELLYKRAKKREQQNNEYFDSILNKDIENCIEEVEKGIIESKENEITKKKILKEKIKALKTIRKKQNAFKVEKAQTYFIIDDYPNFSTLPEWLFLDKQNTPPFFCVERNVRTRNRTFHIFDGYRLMVKDMVVKKNKEE